MARVVVAGAHGGYVGLGLRLAAHVDELGYEAAAAVLELARDLDARGKGVVACGAHA